MAEGRAGSGGPLLAVAAAAVTVLVLLLATWAATSGPDDPLRGAGIRPDPMETVPTSATPSEPAEDTAGEREGGSATTLLLARILGAVVLVLVALLVAGAVWALVRGVRSLLEARRPRRGPPPEPSTPLDPVTAIAAAIADDAAAQLDLLTEGSPRNGIVQCWHRFEVQAARAGTPRREWETSAEFTIRLLDLVEADAPSVSRLAALYREARFSDHEVGEAARAEAVAVLERIHRDLRGVLGRSVR